MFPFIFNTSFHNISQTDLTFHSRVQLFFALGSKFTLKMGEPAKSSHSLGALGISKRKAADSHFLQGPAFKRPKNLGHNNNGTMTMTMDELTPSANATSLTPLRRSKRKAAASPLQQGPAAKRRPNLEYDHNGAMTVDELTTPSSTTTTSLPLLRRSKRKIAQRPTLKLPLQTYRRKADR